MITSTPENDGADRPAPHGPTGAAAAAPYKRRTCVLVWRDGMLVQPAETLQLTVLQFAMMTQATGVRS